MVLSEAFQSYADDVISYRNQSSRTEEQHFATLKLLLVFFGDVDIECLSFQMVRMWKVELEKKRCAGTVRMYIIRLRVVLVYCNSNGVPCLSADQVPVPKRADRVPEFITKEQVAEFIQAVQPRNSKVNRLRNAAIVALLYSSGIRVSELVHLNKADIRDDHTFTIIGKGGYVRLCFVDDRAFDLIRAYLSVRTDELAALFLCTKEQARINAGAVQEIFRNGSKVVGYYVHPHTLRHSFATDLLRNNANLYYVSKLLGHRQLDTTATYLHVANFDLEKVYKEHHTI